MTSSKAQGSEKQKEAVLQVLSYFDFFQYPLTLEQIHAFLPIKAPKNRVLRSLKELERGRKVVSDKENAQYALGGHSIFFSERVSREVQTAKKLKKTSMYILLLSKMPCTRLVGLSGSCAMMNAREKDDIDMFIISAPGRIWLSRITAILLAKTFRIHRHKFTQRTQDTACLNLFFDARNMKVPTHKRNLYTAHEVIQMVPQVSKGNTYEMFLTENDWVYQYFPNMQKQSNQTEYSKYRIPIISTIVDRLELAAKAFQLSIMTKRTQEIITDTQLWFFPRDFEKTIKKKVNIS